VFNVWVSRILRAGASALLLGTAAIARAATAPPAAELEFFYEEGCAVCERVAREVLPELESDFPESLRLHRYETSSQTNYLRLAAYQDRLAIRANESAVIVVNGRRAFAGWSQIREDLPAYLAELATHGAAARTNAAEPAAPVEGAGASVDRLAERVRHFTAISVAVAGFVDGINPCAISSLVFLISLLATLKVSKRRLLLVGIAFCAASFITYLAIGFGLFRALHAFAGFKALRGTVEAVMIGVLAVFALLSFRDAIRYKATGDGSQVALKLPRAVMMASHRIMRGSLKTHHLLAGSFVAGTAVTVLESVCTGQVYVPTLVLVVKAGNSTLPALGYLLFYNLLFITPLVAAFILTYRGLSMERLLRWSRQNVVTSKSLMGVLFVVLAVLIVVL
jgi:hypothetical protein